MLFLTRLAQRALPRRRRRPDQIAEALTARGLTVDAVDRVRFRGRSRPRHRHPGQPAGLPGPSRHRPGTGRRVRRSPALAPRSVRKPRKEDGARLEALVSVRIEDRELCARYTARLVRGVQIGPSPTGSPTAAGRLRAALDQQRGRRLQPRYAGTGQSDPLLRPTASVNRDGSWSGPPGIDSR